MKAERPLPSRPTKGEADWAEKVWAAAHTDVRTVLRLARRRRWEHWLAVSMVVVAVGAVVVLLMTVGVVNQREAGSPVRNPAAVQATGSSTEAPRTVDLARPFAGTPAAGWADGRHGIVTPRPQRAGGFTMAEVAEATRLVRKALIAARLDERMLLHHDPSRYLDLLAPDAAQQLRPLFGTGREAKAQALVSLIADGYELLPVEPKARGRMWIEPGETGELVVHTNYVFAYAFQPTGSAVPVSATDIIVVVRADVDYVLRSGPHWTPGSQGLWYDKATSFGYSISCDHYREGFLAPMLAEHQSIGGKSEPSVYFDPRSPLPDDVDCH